MVTWHQSIRDPHQHLPRHPPKLLSPVGSGLLEMSFRNRNCFPSSLQSRFELAESQACHGWTIEEASEGSPQALHTFRNPQLLGPHRLLGELNKLKESLQLSQTFWMLQKLLHVSEDNKELNGGVVVKEKNEV